MQCLVSQQRRFVINKCAGGRYTTSSYPSLGEVYHPVPVLHVLHAQPPPTGGRASMLLRRLDDSPGQPQRSTACQTHRRALTGPAQQRAVRMLQCSMCLCPLGRVLKGGWGAGGWRGGPGTQKSKSLCTKNSPNQFPFPFAKFHFFPP